ncbi:helix-turn-helix transcriptional regulator [Lentzea nigeriaca]|uniref:helix-turn-helix transcriptional regulator n=1 Tax=Lentzea nigeriaca TaxID=1128665 RepID=UPI00195B495C|nr:LuxR family transcriptional regulator [Lentzea nigeriaca]MBM7856374.1 DNA-binding CsgD family transcriptional regulator [Lentzea nigeriaca]
MIVGRHAELAVIDRLIDRARGGSGGGLVVRGEAGIGKSTLLGRAYAEARDLRVLRVVGVESESQFAYAALHQLLSPVLDRVDRLPEPQAAALGAAFGRGGSDELQPFLVSMAALTLLSDLADEQPVLCVVDDAHWSDAASLDVFLFVARRLEAESIALLVAVRDDEGRTIDAAGVPELRLGGLDLAAARTLLGDRVSPLLLEQLVTSTGGNPLALIELADLSPHEVMQAPVPLASRLEQVFLARIRKLGPELGTVLLLAAAAGPAGRELVRTAAAQLGVDRHLDSPEAGQILHDLDFRHPLMRSAVYHGAAAADRLAAHRALADADTERTDRWAWHRAKAVEGPDEEVAAALESSAAQAIRRSGHLAAAAALERAAELSPSTEDTQRRLVAAADAWWRGGDTTSALDSLDRVEDSAEVLYLRGSIELRAGSPSDAVALLVSAALAASDPHRTLQIVTLAREAAYTAVRPEVLDALASRLAQLPQFTDETDRLLARLLRAFIGTRMDHEQAVEVADLLAEAERFEDPELLLTAGGMAWAVGQYALSARLRQKAVARARAAGAAGTLALTLEYVVPDEISRGRFASAEAFADEGFRLAVETGRRNSASLHQAFLSMLAGLRGRTAEAVALAEQTMTEAVSRSLVKVADTAQRALGLMALADRRHEDALAVFAKLDGSGPEPGSPVMAVSAIPDHVEAAVRAGLTPTGLLDRYLTWVDTVSSVELQALAERTLALLATDPDAADAHYAEALRLHATTERPFDHARTELLYGEFLRRERRRTQSRRHLRSAMDTFTRLGTPVWAERARVELRATGETARRQEPGRTAELTPQELQVARSVSLGATNREVAAQLFVSPRTVDYHLRKVFRKLGITSRRELMRLDL